jgi:hypothetical protein
MAVDAAYRTILTPDRIRAIVDLVPDEWLTDDDSPQPQRDAYVQFLTDRLAHSERFVNEAHHARQALI